MSIAIIKNGEIEILAEINLSPLALYGYKRYEPQVESLGFKIIDSSGELKYSNKYKLDYKKGNSVLNFGIISFTSDNAENTLRTSFKNYDFILSKINSNKNDSNQVDNKEPSINNNPEPNSKEKPKDPDDSKNNNNNNDKIPEANKNILETAKLFVGSTDWVEGVIRISFDNQVKVLDGEPKCNLFVHEMLEMSGIHMDLPNSYGKRHKTPDYPKRPYVCKQWQKEQVKNFKCIGKGVKALNNSLPGDIITNGTHIGIISGPNKTISASSRENKVVENDWGWRKIQRNSVKIFRYQP